MGNEVTGKKTPSASVTDHDECLFQKILCQQTIFSHIDERRRGRRGREVNVSVQMTILIRNENKNDKDCLLETSFQRNII